MKCVWEDAMHRVESETFSDSDEDFDALAELSKAGNISSKNLLSAVKREIAEVLTDAGFSDPGKSIFHKGRFWCDVQEGERPTGKAVSPGWAFARSQSEPLTPVHEAASIYMGIIFLESALAHGDMEKVFFNAFQLGVGINRFNARRRHLKRITIRKKSERGLREVSEGRAAANAEKAAKAKQWKMIAIRMANEYKERNPQASKSSIAIWISRNWPEDAGVLRPATNTIRQAI
ncbi:hypothetical protein RIdsm_02747 [Roseovarius indicus]|uniref:Uncharacterized protein n=2 Tax=Roseovarius indicus TaxID=540747 RepID=A0A5P3AC64_9RHOB|nr:hypothetical protein RIdsm_02747 [Roseovarius indicus]SFD57436.1 hypothetical protein SAMN04488031_101598 [Roseovarius indicus]